jgi:D-galactose 1-dehydrogenase
VPAETSGRAVTGNDLPGAQSRIRIGIVGFGKIARDHHVPAIAKCEGLRLHSTADPSTAAAAVPHHRDIEAMLSAAEAPEAVAICTPPGNRFAIARYALARGRHVLLEKPPCAAVEEVEALASQAADAGLTLFCAWHSRYAPAVPPARAWLADRRLRHLRIDWREDVRDWHPNQAWIWAADGFGVFDPGINALSIATMILPQPLVLRSASLSVPANCEAPAVAELHFTGADAADIHAYFDFLEPGPPTWRMSGETTDGESLLLTGGGSGLAIDGVEIPLGPRDEYAALYAHFHRLIAAGNSDADAEPLRLVTEALARGRRIVMPPLDASYGLAR